MAFHPGSLLRVFVRSFPGRPAPSPAPPLPEAPALACDLFAGGWLPGPDAPAGSIPAGLDAAVRDLDSALARFRAETARAAAETDSARRDALIEALQTLELRDLPAAADAAEAALDRLMRSAGFRNRALMPLFPPVAACVARVRREALLLCRDARWRLMVARAALDAGIPAGPVQGEATNLDAVGHDVMQGVAV